MDILKKTEKCKEYLLKIDAQFEEVRTNGEVKDFYSVIQPFVDEVHEFIEIWRVEAKKWVEENQPKNLHPQQIDAAVENMKEICAQAFFPQTSYKRFKHHVHSINYCFEKLISEIRKLQ